MADYSAAEVVLIITAVGAIVSNAIATWNVSAKADVIVGHVDGQASAAQGREDGLKNELRLVREELAERKQAAALVAQAAATRTGIAESPPVAAPPAP